MDIDFLLIMMLIAFIVGLVSGVSLTRPPAPPRYDSKRGLILRNGEAPSVVIRCAYNIRIRNVSVWPRLAGA